MPRRKDLAVVILAAGKGTRLLSQTPKALHTLCGEPMLGVLLKTAQTLKPSKILVVAGYGRDRVSRYLKTLASNTRIVYQRALLGSGHAVAQAARPLTGFKGSVVVLYCDTPLLSAGTLESLVRVHEGGNHDGTLLTVELENPSGYGRICRGLGGAIERIIEEKDATAGEKAIREINVGAYIFRIPKLLRALKRVRKNPIKKEYYLTDVIEILAEEGDIGSWKTGDPAEARGVNTRLDLAQLEEAMQKKILENWILKGVHIRDPKTTVIDAGVRLGPGTVVQPHTVIEDACVIGSGCTVGPFARIRGASRVGDGCLIGNFVEIVRSRIGRNTQIKHLSYIGDAEIGSNVNVGAGTITANFDGKKKHKTIIRDRAQLGSGTVLVAPVTVGRAAKTGAGAVVTKGQRIPERAVVAGVPARPLQKRHR